MSESTPGLSSWLSPLTAQGLGSGGQMGRNPEAELALGSGAHGSGLPQCNYCPSLNCSAFIFDINKR